MRAGLLTEPITIKRATITKNDFGEETEVWTIVYQTRARVIQTNSNKAIENGEVLMNYTKEFHMRYYVPIQEFDIIEWDGKLYRVISMDKNKTEVYIKVTGALIND